MNVNHGKKKVLQRMPALGCGKFTHTCRGYQKKLQYLYCLPYAGTVIKYHKKYEECIQKFSWGI